LLAHFGQRLFLNGRTWLPSKDEAYPQGRVPPDPLENPNVTLFPIRRLAPWCAAIALMLSTPLVHAKDEHDTDEFEVRVSKGQVTVVAKGEWHINQEFPWKLTVGDTKLDKSKFTLTEKNATVSDAPAGAGKLKGAVCSHDSCHTLEREVTVP
jgi:hypothetical protein